MSQREVPGLGNDVVRLIDATSGNEPYALPTNFAVGRKLVVRRSDASANAVIISVPSGNTLDGATDGTATVSKQSEKWFQLTDPGTWVSFGGSSSGGAGGVTPIGITNPVAPYSPAGQVYNLKPSHLRRYRAALGKAAAGTAICNITCLGDSITAGQSAVFGTQSWPAVMRDRLSSAGLPITGTGWVSPASGQSGVDPRWTFASSNWPTFTNTYQLLKFRSVSGAQATFTSDKAGTILELMYSNASAAFTVAIDGSSAVTVTPSGAQTIATYTVTSLANTTHTVVITTSSASAVYIGPARVRGAAGVSVNNMGIGGAMASDIQFGQSYSNGSIVKSNVGADLMFISYMTNERQNSVSAADYGTAMSTLIDQMSPVADVVLIAAIPASAFLLTDYRTVLYGLADSKDLPLIDFGDRWGTYASANGLGLYTDTLHPNANGYADLGACAARLLLNV